MIWFKTDNKGGFDLGSPDWSGASTKADANEPVSNIVIGESVVRPPSGQQRSAAPPPEPPPPQPAPEPAPPPEPVPDPRIENNLKLLAASISELARQKQALEERDLNFCVSLAFAIAEQLTCGTLEANPEKTMEIVKESLGMFDDGDKPVVKLHPEIYAAFEELEMLETLSAMDDVTVKADAAVSRMGCVVTAGKKTVNGEVPARLEKLKTLFAMEQGNGTERT